MAKASTRDTDMKQRLVLKLLVGIALTLGAFSASAQPRQSVTPGQIAAQENVKTCLTCHGGDPKVTAILQSPMATMGDQRMIVATEKSIQPSIRPAA